MKKLKIGNALIWASIMLASALISENSPPMMISLYIMGWFMSDMLLGKAQSEQGSGCNK